MTGQDGEKLMREALSLSNAYGLRRLSSDTFPEIAEWAARLSGHSGSDVALAHRPAVAVAERATRRGEPKPAAPPPAVSPSALLTPKEREVLELLARRLSNKQIAAALDVGDATIKWHLKNLFAKLSAGTREHALQRARMLGILMGI
jgi:LuxR family maltose regulon positive regulatory protein